MYRRWETEEGWAGQVGRALCLGGLITQNPAGKPQSAERQSGATADSGAKAWPARSRAGVRGVRAGIGGCSWGGWLAGAAAMR